MKKTVLLAGAMIVFGSAPACAEMLSTPSEQAQTRALNNGAQTGTYTTADALNGRSNPLEPNNIPDPPFGRPAQPSAFGPGGPSLPPAMTQKRPSANTDDFIALETVDPDRLEGDIVQTSDGNPIGRVRDVKLGSDGAPKTVAIELNDGRNVRVPQEELMFNPKENVLLASVDETQMADSDDTSPSGSAMSKHGTKAYENPAAMGDTSNGSGVNPSEAGAGSAGQ